MLTKLPKQRVVGINQFTLKERKEVITMRQITKVRKAVCVMANELKKVGYSLSQAFKKAWAQVKNTMKVRVYF